MVLPHESSWVWGEPQHPVTAAPGAAPAAADPCLSAERVSFEHWQLPVARERAQTHPPAQLLSSYLQVINKSFTVYCNHSAKTQTKSTAVTTSKAACSHRSGKQTFWVLPSEKGFAEPWVAQAPPAVTAVPVRWCPGQTQPPAKGPVLRNRHTITPQVLLRSSCSLQAPFGRAAGNPSGLCVSPPPSHNCSEGASPQVTPQHCRWVQGLLTASSHCFLPKHHGKGAERSKTANLPLLCW